MTSAQCNLRYVSRAQQQLTLQSSKNALKVRSQLGITLVAPLCVYQVAEALGVEVRFVDIPSMEGMYCRISSPTILLSSHRPAGRQRFTAAHELGHHVFGHGEHIHELLDRRESTYKYTPEEQIADAFAACLLMPKSAVGNAFAIRGISPMFCSHLDVYAVAWLFGVGYETLIQHMRLTLGVISEERARLLLRYSPKSIRKELLGQQIEEDIIPIDFSWNGRAIDAQIGDLVRLPRGVQVEGSCMETVCNSIDNTTVRAIQPGVGRLVNNAPDWASFVRVSRRDFVGRACYRFLEDQEDE